MSFGIQTYNADGSPNIGIANKVVYFITSFTIQVTASANTLVSYTHTGGFTPSSMFLISNLGIYQVAAITLTGISVYTYAAIDSPITFSIFSY